MMDLFRVGRLADRGTRGGVAVVTAVIENVSKLRSHGRYSQRLDPGSQDFSGVWIVRFCFLTILLSRLSSHS
jgi:hypothetical protein